MSPLRVMLHHTGHHVARQRELFALRTRKAGSTFATETRRASRELASAFRAEADAWRKYVRDGASSLAPATLERQVLVRFAAALRSLDGHVRLRLDALDRPKRPPRRGKAKRRSRAPARRVTAAKSSSAG